VIEESRSLAKAVKGSYNRALIEAVVTPYRIFAEAVLKNGRTFN
jgi:hypothetical protein